MSPKNCLEVAKPHSKSASAVFFIQPKFASRLGIELLLTRTLISLLLRLECSLCSKSSILLSNTHKSENICFPQDSRKFIGKNGTMLLEVVMMKYIESQ